MLLSIRINDAHFDSKPYSTVAAWRHWTTYKHRKQEITYFILLFFFFLPEIVQRSSPDANALAADDHVLK